MRMSAEQRELASAFDRALPRSHRRFLASLKASFACGDYFFVHAGVRPGIPLSGQHEQDYYGYGKTSCYMKRVSKRSLFTDTRR